MVRLKHAEYNSLSVELFNAPSILNKNIVVKTEIPYTYETNEEYNFLCVLQTVEDALRVAGKG